MRNAVARAGGRYYEAFSFTEVQQDWVWGRIRKTRDSAVEHNMSVDLPECKLWLCM